MCNEKKTTTKILFNAYNCNSDTKIVTFLKLIQNIDLVFFLKSSLNLNFYKISINKKSIGSKKY